MTSLQDCWLSCASEELTCVVNENPAHKEMSWCQRKYENKSTGFTSENLLKGHKETDYFVVLSFLERL